MQTHELNREQVVEIVEHQERLLMLADELAHQVLHKLPYPKPGEMVEIISAADNYVEAKQPDFSAGTGA